MGYRNILTGKFGTSPNSIHRRNNNDVIYMLYRNGHIKSKDDINKVVKKITTASTGTIYVELNTGITYRLSDHYNSNSNAITYTGRCPDYGIKNNNLELFNKLVELGIFNV